MRAPRPSAPIPPRAAVAVDPSFPRSLILAGRRRWPLLLIGLAAYAIALIATGPARLIVDAGEGTNIADVAGTIWHGQAALAGGQRLEWRWAPLRSLAGFGFAADWTASGPATSLSGRALLRPGAILVSEASGSADGGLLASLFPRLPFACDLPLQIDSASAKIGGSEQRIIGRALADPGSCAPKGAANLTAPVPALLFEALPDGPATRGHIVAQTQRRTDLATFTLSPEGVFRLVVTPQGAKALPFAAPPGGMTIEKRF